MTTHAGPHELKHLSRSACHLVDPSEDVRGREVIDTDGQVIGTIEDLIFDQVDLRVRYLDVAAHDTAGLTADHRAVPVEAVTAIGPATVRIDRDRVDRGWRPPFRPRLAAPAS